MMRCVTTLLAALLALAAAPAFTAPEATAEARTQSEGNAESQAGTEAAGIRIELNKLEARDQSCRAYLVARNGTDSAFETLRLDLVMFDGDGIVAKRLAVEAGPLPADKTALKVFDINGLACGDIGQILLNDVLECRDQSGTRRDCVGQLSVTSRGEVPFLK